MPAATADRSTDAKRVRFTVEEFERMVEVGIIAEDARVELIEGELYEMAPIGPWHSAGVDALTRTLTAAGAVGPIVRVQSSVRVGAISEPQPDVTVLRYRADFYRNDGAGAEDVLLIIEVSDSSIGHDRNQKLPMYARAGIPEVWVITRFPAVIEVYRRPSGDAYAERREFVRGETVSPLLVPGVEVVVAEVTG